MEVSTPASPALPPAAPALPPILPRRIRLTPGQVEGPYFIANAPLRNRLFPQSALSPSGVTSADLLENIPDQLEVSGQVLNIDCATLGGATVSVWVADPQGRYDNQDDVGNPIDVPVEQQLYRGRMVTDKDGHFAFSCLRPGNYFDEGWKLWRPAHIHVKVEASGYENLVTQLYFDDDAHNALDIPGDDFFLPELVVQLSPAVPVKGQIQKGYFNLVLARVA
jgi:protocatechuate 3,4-dioxygenase beta subunit